MIRRIAQRVIPVFSILCLMPIIPTQRSHAAEPASSMISEALSFMPATATAVFFTDWALIKQYQGAAALTGTSPMSAKQKFLNNLSTNQAVAAQFGLNFYQRMSGLWSFDSFDLQWEAEAETSSTPVSVLRFNDSFNFAPVLAHFVQRKYTKTAYHGIALYSHRMDFTQSWFTQGPLDVLNAAYLPDLHVLVFSSAQGSVKAALDAYREFAPSLAHITSMQAMVGALGVIAAAIYELERGACSAFALPAGTSSGNEPTSLATLRKQVHRYDAFAIGYRDEGGHPLGIAGLHFAAPADAAADLPVRRTIAATGTSLVVRVPYSESVFTLLNASVAGSNLLFHLRPFQNQPKRLFNMVLQRDVMFALCP